MAEISDYLQGLGEQTVQEEKKIIVVDSVVNLLLDKMEELVTSPIKNSLFYDFCIYNVLKFKYSSNDICSFSIELKRCEEFVRKHQLRVGQFISALINNCQEEDIEIFTRHLNETLIGCLGYRNTKKLTVFGDVGYLLGEKMQSTPNSMIIVKGSVQDSAGQQMEGGKLIIEKDSGRYTGLRATGGEIIIKRNTGEMTGNLLDGGTIIIDGTAGDNLGRGLISGKIKVKNAKGLVGCVADGGEIYVSERSGDIAESCKARVYLKGKLIWPR